MADEFEFIRENYKEICFNVENTKEKYRKPDDSVEIMAVTKTVPAVAVNVAIDCGVKLLGENRVQEYLSKKDDYKRSADVHFIGQLQSNKVKFLGDIKLIQSVGSVTLLGEIDKLAKSKGKILDILVEVNIGNECSKGGIAPDALEMFLRQAAVYGNIHVEGLMTIPPFGGLEKYFCQMNELFIDIREKNMDNIDMRILSMGMSNDYVMAIKHGANIVRIGTKLFGARDYV